MAITLLTINERTPTLLEQAELIPELSVDEYQTSGRSSLTNLIAVLLSKTPTSNDAKIILEDLLSIPTGRED